MRVLHVVTTAQRRGAEVFASDLVRALDEAGVDQQVTVLQGRPPSAVEFPAPISFLESGRREVPGLRLNAGAVRALRELVARLGPDVVQAHGGEPLKYALCAARGGVAVVYRRIGAVSPWIPPGLRRRIHGALMRRASRIVAVAEALRRETVETFRIPPDRVVTIPNAVDARRMDARSSRQATRRALGIPMQAPVVLSLGAVSWEKAPYQQLEAAAGALRSCPEAVYLWAGDGPMRREVEANLAIRVGGVDGRIRFLGNRPDVADLLGASDILLLASLTEGMPACLIEAGMAGLPVAALAVGGISEVVVDGATGVLAPAGDVCALSVRLAELIRDGEARRAMGRKASNWCRFRFDMRAVAPSYLELYDSLSGTAGARSARNGCALHGR